MPNSTSTLQARALRSTRVSEPEVPLFEPKLFARNASVALPLALASAACPPFFPVAVGICAFSDGKRLWNWLHTPSESAARAISESHARHRLAQDS